MRFVDLQILRLLWSRMLENSVGTSIFWPPVGVGAPNHRLHHVGGRNSPKTNLRVGGLGYVIQFFIGLFMHVHHPRVLFCSLRESCKNAG